MPAGRRSARSCRLRRIIRKRFPANRRHVSRKEVHHACPRALQNLRTAIRASIARGSTEEAGRVAAPARRPVAGVSSLLLTCEVSSLLGVAGLRRTDGRSRRDPARHLCASPKRRGRQNDAPARQLATSKRKLIHPPGAFRSFSPVPKLFT